MTNDAQTPPPQTEVQEEVQERLEVLELARTPRAEKLAREGRFLEGATEVRYVERAFRAQHAQGIDEVRSRVDALAPPARRALPDVPPLPPPPDPIPVAAPVAEAHRAALARVIDGELLSAETAFQSDAGDVVEARWENETGTHSGMFVVKDGSAREMDDIASRIDALPPPRAPSPPAPAAPAPVPEKVEKRRFGFPTRKAKDEEATSEPGAGDAAKDEKKRKFGFGRK